MTSRHPLPMPEPRRSFSSKETHAQEFAHRRESPKWVQGGADNGNAMRLQVGMLFVSVGGGLDELSEAQECCFIEPTALDCYWR
jgi:hypothetical protein